MLSYMYIVHVHIFKCPRSGRFIQVHCTLLLCMARYSLCGETYRDSSIVYMYMYNHVVATLYISIAPFVCDCTRTCMYIVYVMRESSFSPFWITVVAEDYLVCSSVID